ncbi:MAG: MBL fold metallo-hydrolase [Bacteroidetes bacterium]|nr:MBL fold metallo-hydrolase [Bacteroidota bacterium]
MKIKKFTFNPFMENTFVVWDEQSHEAAVVDPGMNDEQEEREFKSFIEENSLDIKYLINTHCHIDHILGCRFVKEKYNPVYYIPEKDLPLYDNADKQAEMFGVTLGKLPKIDKYLTEDERIILGNESFSNLFTPGHSPGEFCLYFDESKFCITGDVLFREGIGRTDLYGGDYNTLIESIKAKLFSLPDDILIYPGHGDESTIGYEKLHNPFLV